MCVLFTALPLRYDANGRIVRAYNQGNWSPPSKKAETTIPLFLKDALANFFGEIY